MNKFRITVTAIAVAILITLSAASATANQFDKKTLVMFDQPVEVPGTVLPAGDVRIQPYQRQSQRGADIQRGRDARLRDVIGDSGLPNGACGRDGYHF
jgi:hypothetical protein